VIFIRRVSTKDPRFRGRSILLDFREGPEIILVPDEDVVCNGCNRNIYPDDGFLVYLDKWALKNDLPYDIYCESCVKRYFRKAREVE